MKLRLRAAAVGDMDAIFDYSATMHGGADAQAYLRDLNAAMERLLDFPELGVSRESLRPGLRSLPAGEHRIFYRIERLEIVVARVLHKAMDEQHPL